MDHRDAMNIFGTYLKSLPDYEFNRDTMTATFVEHDRDTDSPPEREKSPLELEGERLDKLIAEKLDRLADKLPTPDGRSRGFSKHFTRRVSHSGMTLRESIIDAIKNRRPGHFAHAWLYVPEMGYDYNDWKTKEPRRRQMERAKLEVSLGMQHWLIPEGGSFKDRYWPKSIRVKFMVNDEKIGGSGWHFKAPFQFEIPGMKGIHSLAQLGREINRRLHGEVTPEDLKPQLRDFLLSREAGDVTDYHGVHQGWMVDDDTLAAAREKLGDWVLHFLHLEPKTHTIHMRWEVCDTCCGTGKHVNPSIDAHGISPEEFDEDPDFAEDYFQGRYDVTCYECKGRTTSPAIDTDNTDEETLRFINQWFEDEASHRAEVAAERRMGA